MVNTLAKKLVKTRQEVALREESLTRGLFSQMGAKQCPQKWSSFQHIRLIKSIL